MDVGVGHGHHDEEVGDRPVAREPLVTVDDPLVTVTGGPGGDHGRIGPGSRFGHREPAPQLPVEQRLKPTLPLLLPARGLDADGQQLGIARIGGVVAEDHRPVGGLAEDLVHEPETDLSEPPTTQLGRQMGGPQAPSLDFFLQRDDRREQAVVIETTSVSKGKTSSRTKPRIQSSCASNSGSVEKSHANVRPPVARFGGVLSGPTTVSRMPGDAASSPIRTTVRLGAPVRDSRRAAGTVVDDLTARQRIHQAETALLDERRQLTAGSSAGWPSSLIPGHVTRRPRPPGAAGLVRARRSRSRASCRPRPAGAPRTATSAPSRPDSTARSRPRRSSTPTRC